MAKSTVFIFPSTNANQGSPSISFDAVTDIKPVFTKTVSKVPVSDGSVITDHEVTNNPTLTIEAYVSHYPLVVNENNIIDQGDTALRVQAAYIALRDIYQNSTPQTIVHRFDTFEDYILTNFEPIIMPNDSIGFRLIFEKVRFATEQRVNLIVNMSQSLAADSSRTRNTGLGTKTATEEDVKYILPRIFRQTGEGLIYEDPQEAVRAEQNAQATSGG